jgi:REP element-mobilizing transposase RayT
MVDFEAEPALHEMDTDKIQPVQKPSVELPPYEFKDGDDEDIDALVGDALDELEADTATFNVSELSEHQSDFDEYATDPVGAFEPKPFAKSSSESEGTQQTLGLESADPEIAQLALTLTQVSLELTAEATLLAREGEIVAFSGTMPFEDVQDLGDVIGHDWGAKVGEARIRFVTLPGSGKDYMLYSRMADGGFALSMIFAGNMPLRVIRRQSDRLINALGAVPEPEAPEPLESSLIDELQIMEELRQLEERAASEEEAAIESSQQLILEYPELGEIEEDEDEYVDDEILEAEFYEEAEDEIAEDEDQEEAEPEFTPAEAVQPVVERQVAPVKIPQLPTKPLVSYTYIWMIRDANKPLGKEVAEAIVTELDKQLTEIGWRCNILHVFEDYVYLVADVPADTLSHEILPELKRRSAQIAYSVDNSMTTENLWADSYLVLTPGRELHISEIQRFINFSGAG